MNKEKKEFFDCPQCGQKKEIIESNGEKVCSSCGTPVELNVDSSRTFSEEVGFGL
ncbi:MAG: hypothetical protein V1860_02660 [bacterium]